MDYWVIQTSYNGVNRTPLSNLFATPYQAECHRARIGVTGRGGYQYAVRPATWQEREARMFYPDPETMVAVYSQPVWENETWWVNVSHMFKEHYVHISFLDPTAIAFTEDERKGEADRQTMMRPGKYLQKFLGGGADGLIEHGPIKGWPAQITKMQIAFYADWHQAGRRPTSDDILTFTEDADEMVRLYEEGPDSCMMGKGWDTARHPVRVYAGGGLALAALTSVSGAVIGRALCWPAKQAFGRVYPTPNTSEQHNHYNELMSRLKAKGWTSITENNSVFEGALLRQLTNRHGGYLMPYLDNEYGVEDVYRDGQSWWRMTHDENHQENTDGTMVNSDPDWRCDCCEGGFSDEYDYCTVYRSWGPSGAVRADGTRPGYSRGDEMWCRDCRDNNTFYCEGSDEHYTDSCDSVYASDGNTYEYNWFYANGGWQDAYDDEYYFRDTDTPVRLGDGALIHVDYLKDASVVFQCFATGLWWFLDHQSEAAPGYHVSFDVSAQHPVEWECVTPTLPEDPADVEAWAKAYANPPHAYLPTDEDPVVINLERSGLRYDPAMIVSDNLNRSFVTAAL